MVSLSCSGSPPMPRIRPIHAGSPCITLVRVDSGQNEEVCGWAEVFSTCPVMGHAVLNYTTQVECVPK